MPEMPQLSVSITRGNRHDDLEIAMRASLEIALDNGARPRYICGHSLTLLPRLVHIRIVVPVVPQIDAAIG
jgi:predicted lipase